MNASDSKSSKWDNICNVCPKRADPNPISSHDRTSEIQQKALVTERGLKTRKRNHTQLRN